MTTSPVRRGKSRKINNLNSILGPSSARVRAISIDGAVNVAYLKRNRTSHASASVCAPGGSFFALNMGKAGFQ